VERSKPKIGRQETDEPHPELDRLARQIIGAAIEVHRLLGPGLLESVYEEALCIELGLRAIPFARQVPLSVAYKNHRRRSAAGFAHLERLIVELKSVDSLAPIHVAQLLSY
jgi:GxxExxY protein